MAQSRVTLTALCGVFCVSLAGVLVGTARPAAGQVAAASPNPFERAYFLQTHERDLDGAAKLYEQVAADQGVSEAIRGEAKTRLQACREDLASADLARLMPADALAYVEVSRPGTQIARLAKLLGLLEPPGAPRDKPAPAIPLGNGLFLPTDFHLSPALVAELEKIHGVAAAITSVDARGEPDGVVVLHPGDSDLLRGVLETAVQVLEPVGTVEGHRVYRIERDAWVAVTARLFVAGRTREQVASAVARLTKGGESLAARSDFQRLAADRKNALVFAYVNGPQAVKQLGSQLRGEDAAIARALLDLEHFESLVATVGVGDDAVHARVEMNLLPGHRNVAYGLIRTAPLTRRSLAYVPQGAAAVAMIGLNPPAERSSPIQAGEAQPLVSAMDVGRELFGNIDEVAVFVMPSAGASGGRAPVPDFGVAFAVKDAARSEALWTQLLSLAALAGVSPEQAMRDVTVEGRPAKEYRFPGAPPLTVLRVADGALLVGTSPAIAASAKAAATQEGIDKDAGFAPLLAQLTPESSKAVLVDAGRAVQTARAMPGVNSSELLLVGVALKDLKVAAVSDEAPNRWTLRASVTGLPNLPSLMRIFAGQIPGPAASASKD